MARGRPKGAPKTPGSGRKAGTPNKATANIRALAQGYGPAVIEELARLAMEAGSEAALVAAIKELLDRAYGRAPATVDTTIYRDKHEFSDEELVAIIRAAQLDGTVGEVDPDPDEVLH